MDSGNEWLLLLCGGLCFSFVGALKLYGLYKVHAKPPELSPLTRKGRA